MSATPNPFNTRQNFSVAGASHDFYSLPELQKTFPNLNRLPVSIRLVLESLLRNCDGKRVSEQAVRDLANWKPNAPRTAEIPFVVARIVLQDFTGVPLLVDLAAMRSAVARLGKNPALIEPLVPVDLVVDHSVQVDYAGTTAALEKNLDLEFKRNRERYEFLKWGMQAFDTFKVVPPGIGIVHQVNLEYLAKGILADNTNTCYPDTLVGTDSHTTMINGLGIVGWGVGGIEAEAGMLGQPVYFLTPDVVGVHLTGSLPEGVTGTDLALTLTQLLRNAKVVGKFVEYYGPGAAALPVVDRAMIANMAPEYGATMGFFPIDAECANYLRATGRDEQHIQRYQAYYQAQQLWGIPQKGDIDYSQTLELDLSTIVPSVAGPKRPQDRIELPNLKNTFQQFLTTTPRQAAAKSESPNVETPLDKAPITHGSVLIAAITSCTNTSNPAVMLAAGLLAQNAVARGLKVPPHVKTSLAPGSRVVTDYLQKTGLQPALDQLGFQTVGYGCTTCIGNSGPLDPEIENTITQNDLIAASVLSGNRNFEARVHQNIKSNFLMSPPLVVAFALAGHIDIDLTRDPIGNGADNQPVYLRDIWPGSEQIAAAMASALNPETFKKLYTGFATQNPKWNEIPSTAGQTYQFNPDSTYIQEPPFFQNFTPVPEKPAPIQNARALGIFGDSVTTDHISPAGAIKKASPAGKYLTDHHVAFEDFNSYGSRRGNDRVMTRGTFANVRIKNLMLNGEEGGNTLLQPEGDKLPIYDAALEYQKRDTPLVIIAGQEYGTGSSRDWAAKGTKLLGVRAVIAQSYERIHRSNLVGMGILPLQFPENTNAQTLGLDGTETYTIETPEKIIPQQTINLLITRANGEQTVVPLRNRIDTPIEIDYYQHGGILPYVLRQIISK